MLFRDELDRVELPHLEDIAADDRRAGSVIHRVRAMLRQGETEPQRVVANDLIAEVLDLAHSDLIQRSVTVTTRLDPSLPSVAADRVQLQQVLLNLIVNACDAMDDNAPTDRQIWIATANEGAAIRVSVSDCGAGISRHPVDSVFEPFITSKAHGLGLGLSICQSTRPLIRTLRGSSRSRLRFLPTVCTGCSVGSADRRSRSCCRVRKSRSRCRRFGGLPN
jgi:C4-dicarboxylate-specific signal transduction histidine kinase